VRRMLRVLLCDYHHIQSSFLAVQRTQVGGHRVPLLEGGWQL